MGWFCEKRKKDNQYVAMEDILERNLKFPNDENLPNKADFIFDESRRFLLSTTETTESLKKKINLILIYIFSVMSLIFSIFLKIISSNTGIIIIDQRLSFLFLLLFLYALSSIIIVFKGFIPKDQHVNGNEPHNILEQANISQSLTLMKIAQAMEYQDRIIFNDKANIKLARLVRWSVIGLIAIPIVLILIFLYVQHFL